MLLMSTFHYYYNSNYIANYIANHFIFSTTSTITTSHRQMIEVLQGSTTTTTAQRQILMDFFVRSFCEMDSIDEKN